MVKRKKERSRNRAARMDRTTLKLFGMRRIYRIMNAGFRELCAVKEGVDEMIDKITLRWFGKLKEFKVEGLLKGNTRSSGYGAQKVK